MDGLPPTVFAHAHLAALDTFLELFWTLALLAADRGLGHRRPVLAMTGAGVALALALLTKIHAWFLLPIVLAWAWYRAGIRRGVASWGAWAGTGIVLLVITNRDTIPHLRRCITRAARKRLCSNKV